MSNGDNEKFPRDRDGEIFEDDLTENRDPSPQAREKAAHDRPLDPGGVNSQEGDEFMRERLFEPKPDPKSHPSR
jgi:hypothetical protein